MMLLNFIFKVYDDQTKPSRLKRRRKKKWKIDSLALTGGKQGFMLTLPFPMEAVRLRTLQNNTVRPIALNLVNRFFYAYRKGAALIRAYLSSMVGHFLGAATVFAAFEPWILSHRPRFRTLAGGYFAYNTGNHMNTHSPGHQSAQKTTKTALFSIFWHRQTICQNVSGALALRFKRRHPACIVKFAGFEGGYYE